MNTSDSVSDEIPQAPPLPPSLKQDQPNSPSSKSFRKVEMSSKDPAPLLSRRKKNPSTANDRPESYALKTPPKEFQKRAVVPRTTVELFKEKKKTENPTTTTAASRREKPENKLLRFLGVGAIVVALVSGIGYSTYLMIRETRLEGTVAAPGFKILQVAVVRDFRPDVYSLTNELQLAHAPLIADIKESQDVIARIKGDIAGRDERLNLLEEEADQTEKEIDDVLKEAGSAAQKMWSGPGAQLDEEYTQKLKEFGDRLVERAKQLNLTFELNQEFKSPEVWTNAFRLSLYNAPASVNPTAQREWAEQQLADWNAYLKTRDQKVADLKTKAGELQTVPKEKVEQINRREADLQDQITMVKAEIDPLEKELKDKEAELAKQQGENASLEEVFYPQLVDAAESSKLLTLSVNEESGVFTWRRIDRSPQFPPGDYFLWVKARKEGQEYWSLVPFTLQAYRTTEIIIKKGALIPVTQVLNDAS